jgi:hypothetical protein
MYSIEPVRPLRRYSAGAAPPRAVTLAVGGRDTARNACTSPGATRDASEAASPAAAAVLDVGGRKTAAGPCTSPESP